MTRPHLEPSALTLATFNCKGDTVQCLQAPSSPLLSTAWERFLSRDSNTQWRLLSRQQKFNLTNEELPVTWQGWPGIKWLPLKRYELQLKKSAWPVWEGPMCVQLRTALVGMDAPRMGVWLLIIRRAAGLNGPENSVEEQSGRRALNTEQWTVEAHDTQLMFTVQTFTLSFKPPDFSVGALTLQVEQFKEQF